MTYDKIKYNMEYNKANYTELRFRVQKGQKEIIDKHWKSKGYKSFSAYMNDLIAKDIQSTGNYQEINIEQNNGIIMGDNKGTINM